MTLISGAVLRIRRIDKNNPKDKNSQCELGFLMGAAQSPLRFFVIPKGTQP